MTGEQQQHHASAMDRIVGRLLQAGVVIASVLIGLGVLGTMAGIQPDLATRLVTAGLVTLVLTPVVRVVAAIWIYVRERDFVFAGISLVVLVVLAIGMWMGQTH